MLKAFSVESWAEITNLARALPYGFDSVTLTLPRWHCNRGCFAAHTSLLPNKVSLAESFQYTRMHVKIHLIEPFHVSPPLVQWLNFKVKLVVLLLCPPSPLCLHSAHDTIYRSGSPASSNQVCQPCFLLSHPSMPVYMRQCTTTPVAQGC